MRWSPWEPGGPPPTPAGWLVNLLVVAAILALIMGAVLCRLSHATLV